MMLEKCWEMSASIARGMLCDHRNGSSEQRPESPSPIFPSSLATVVICSRSCPKGTKSATLYSLPRHRKKSCLQKCAGFQGKQAVLRMTVSPNAVRHREAWYIRHDVMPTPKLPKLPSPPCTHQGSTIEGSERSICCRYRKCTCPGKKMDALPPRSNRGLSFCEVLVGQKSHIEPCAQRQPGGRSTIYSSLITKVGSQVQAT
jgi:hypothetical protein